MVEGASTIAKMAFPNDDQAAACLAGVLVTQALELPEKNLYEALVDQTPKEHRRTV